MQLPLPPVPSKIPVLTPFYRRHESSIYEDDDVPGSYLPAEDDEDLDEEVLQKMIRAE